MTEIDRPKLLKELSEFNADIHHIICLFARYRVPLHDLDRLLAELIKLYNIKTKYTKLKAEDDLSESEKKVPESNTSTVKKAPTDSESVVIGKKPIKPKT